MSRFITLALVSLVLILASCEEIFLEADPGMSPEEVFDEAWNFADQEYSFFELKGIDWDEVYTDFRPRVRADMSERELFDLIAEMLFLLRDGHVNLRSAFDRSRNWEWYLNSPENFDGNLLERNYFNRQQRFVGPFTVMDFDDIGYIRYSSFSLLTEEEDVDLVVADFQDKRGIVFDVRNNGGGSLGNVFRIVSRFMDEERLVGIIREKNGPGENEFSEWAGFNVEPEGPIQFTKPVIILTNRRCFSATTIFTTFMNELPHVTVMGDTTGGGAGAPSTTELANGWSIRVSNTQFATPQGFIAEEGIPPDIRVDLTIVAQLNGVDNMLERAFEELRR